jgi:glycosidase
MQTRWEVPRYSNDRTVTPLSQQQKDPQSLYSFYKKWIAYRNKSYALTYGGIESLPGASREVISFFRTHEKQTLMVAHNVSDVEVTVNLPQGYSKLDFETHNGIHIKDNQLILPAKSTAIIAK